MLERQIQHQTGRFPRCDACDAEPRHYESRGRSSREPADLLHPAGIRHSLECRCGMHTGRYARLEIAEREWARNFATRVTASRKAAAA